ncbi:2,3-dihydro-2,3-dihydroxybenzoate dehydrogenase [Paenibacillus sp. MER TA 81-3]|uniref:2,3-dihydro-2,3-dihydroxybenzoate dehydrogenase n=1 Tax=Paenibacillus sp. MER TA 81-3 TaxID=2939573 RepID=UPI00203F0861|nr:2,3-dihydro-2,3-dihydroxybenzoate dehydrogenase [Paenibacillus sp. MER TA 81-3]MCM3341198.1 2,3-dihydro-2,3-dihydroxybenzoate dehydrogenase [Paenibacillus sp. MER TA 81-3]
MDSAGIRGKVALVTGAAQGIGEAVAQALAGLGAIVAAVDRNAAGLSGVVADLSASSLHAVAYPADVGDSSAVDEVVERIERELGPIEIVVNVAGLLRTGPIESLSDEDWKATFAVNVNGVFYVSRSIVRRMALRNSGSIVTVGSNASGVPRAQMSAYAASKAAATMFTKCLGLEYARHNIRCNIVSPGSTDTAMQRALWSSEDGAQAVIAGSPEAFRLGIPLGKLAMPSDITDAVVFLVSDRARHITMHDLCVDGGATLGC